MPKSSCWSLFGKSIKYTYKLFFSPLCATAKNLAKHCKGAPFLAPCLPLLFYEVRTCLNTAFHDNSQGFEALKHVGQSYFSNVFYI